MNTELITTTAGSDLAPAVFAEYADTARKLVSKSKADSTRAVYKSHWQTFSAFCAKVSSDKGTRIEAMPARPETVVAFISHQTDKGRKPATVQAQLAAIAFMHKAAHHPNPCDDMRVTVTMQGMRRDKGIKPTQKQPITLDTLRALVAGLPDDLRGKRNRAMLLVGMWGAFRRSELVALDVQDLTFTRAGASVYVKSSKTDQESEGMTKQLARMADKTICPVHALRVWLKASGISQGALFRGITKHGTLYSGHMDGKEVARIVKRACAAAGYTESELKQFAGHSLRAGFITEAAERGAQQWQIEEQSGHKPGSKVVARYIRTAGRGALAAIGLMAQTESEGGTE